MQKPIRLGFWTFILSCFVFFFQNCDQPGSISLKSESPVTGVAPADNMENDNGIRNSQSYEVKQLDSTKFICEPFSQNPAGNSEGGLKAELAFLNSNANLTTQQKNAFLATDYFSDQAHFTQIDTPIYLSQVNVPTRNFSSGFQLSDGSFLMDSNGAKLVEYFGLKMTSVLKLSNEDLDGYYELATLSDDGTKVYIGEGGNQELLISNDGAHSVRMGCATRVFWMDHQTRLPITIFYNQGPRTEIANVLIWRKSTSPTMIPITTVSTCGATSQTSFWNPTNQQPGSLWLTLQNQGYSIVKTANFELPGGQLNPCANRNFDLIKELQIEQIKGSIGAHILAKFNHMITLKAQLYRIIGADKQLLKEYDYSNTEIQSLDIFSPALSAGIYRLELQSTIASESIRVASEINFQINLL